MHSSEVKIKTTFILLAAGSSSRMKMNIEKQFLIFNGKPIFAHSLEIANNSSFIDEIIIATNKEKIDFVKNYCLENNFQKVKFVISGGDERQKSVYNALKYISNDTTYVAIHDAARPNLEDEYIRNCLEVLENDKEISGTTIGIFAKDTIKIIDNNKNIVKTLDRKKLIHTQTPQVFRKDIILKAHEIAKNKNIIATDDAMLLENINEKVRLVEGKNNNLKITFKDDLKFL